MSLQYETDQFGCAIFLQQAKHYVVYLHQELNTEPEYEEF